MRVMVTDTETGGLDPNKYSLLSVAAVVIDLEAKDFKVIESWDAYHRLADRSHYRTTKEALEINGLDLDAVFNDGIDSETLSNKLIDTWNKHGCTAIAGQNFNFDKKFLARRLFRISDDEFEQAFSRDGRFNVLDTLSIARLLTGKLNVKSMNLGNLAKAFKIDTKEIKGGFHGALFDSLVTAKLLYKQKQMLEMGFMHG